MNLTEVGKVMHAARSVIDGTFKYQRDACATLHISKKGRVAEAFRILTDGCPELIAEVESGRIPFSTGWRIAKELPHDQQLAALERIHRNLKNGGRRPHHGIYAGTRPDRTADRRERHRQERICGAVDMLLDAIVARTDALKVCTHGERPEPEREQGRKWRSQLRRCRRALTALEQQIDWSKTKFHVATNFLEGEGDGHDNSNNEGDGHNDSNNNSEQ